MIELHVHLNICLYYGCTIKIIFFREEASEVFQNYYKCIKKKYTELRDMEKGKIKAVHAVMALQASLNLFIFFFNFQPLYEGIYSVHCLHVSIPSFKFTPVANLRIFDLCWFAWLGFAWPRGLMQQFWLMD